MAFKLFYQTTKINFLLNLFYKRLPALIKIKFHTYLWQNRKDGGIHSIY